jgi:hypothetical protein
LPQTLDIESRTMAYRTHYQAANGVEDGFDPKNTFNMTNGLMHHQNDSLDTIFAITHAFIFFITFCLKFLDQVPVNSFEKLSRVLKKLGD